MYAELQVTTNYSFLRSGSHPGELALQAVELGHSAIGITDRNTLAGVVRAYAALKEYYEEHPTPPEQQTRLLECALFKLTPEKREVLILSRYQEMKYEQIAELMGCEVGAVKVRVHRALKELREIYFKLSTERLPCNVKKSGNNLRIM